MSDPIAAGDLEIAIEHALAVHRLAEAQRRRLAEATTLSEFRDILRECGIPDEDIEDAVATLPLALAARKRRRSLALAGIAAVLVVGAAMAWLVMQPPPAPLAFVGLKYELLDDPPSHSWAQRVTLGGSVETPISTALQAAGLPVLTQIEPAVITRLYRDGKIEPSMERVEDETGATLAVVGSVHCRNQGNIMETAMLSLRAEVRLRPVMLGEGKRVLGEVAEESVSAHIDPTKGCARALDKATGEALPELLKLLGLSKESAAAQSPPTAPN